MHDDDMTSTFQGSIFALDMLVGELLRDHPRRDEIIAIAKRRFLAFREEAHADALEIEPDAQVEACDHAEALIARIEDRF